MLFYSCAHNSSKERLKMRFSVRPSKVDVYIPHGAEKGDCPYCFTGVLFRNVDKEAVLGVRELYTCASCGIDFVENFSVGRRYFSKRVPVFFDVKRRSL
jgi:hypothetical protein